MQDIRQTLQASLIRAPGAIADCSPLSPAVAYDVPVYREGADPRA